MPIQYDSEDFAVRGSSTTGLFSEKRNDRFHTPLSWNEIHDDDLAEIDDLQLRAVCGNLRQSSLWWPECLSTRYMRYFSHTLIIQRWSYMELRDRPHPMCFSKISSRTAVKIAHVNFNSMRPRHQVGGATTYSRKVVLQSNIADRFSVLSASCEYSMESLAASPHFGKRGCR